MSFCLFFFFHVCTGSWRWHCGTGHGEPGHAGVSPWELSCYALAKSKGHRLPNIPSNLYPSALAVALRCPKTTCRGPAVIPLLRGQPGSIFVKTVRKAHLLCCNSEKIIRDGFRDSFDVSRLSFIYATFVVVSFNIMMKGICQDCQLKWENVLTILSSVCSSASSWILY